MPAGKLHFMYAAMNAGKSTLLLQMAHNYREMGMQVMIWSSDQHEVNESGELFVESRIGLREPANVYHKDTPIRDMIKEAHSQSELNAVFVDEAQFLTPDQAWELALVADDLNLPVYTFGLRTDFQGHLFEGSATLLAISDVIQEVKTICHCGRPATMTARRDAEGNFVRTGEQISIAKSDYVSLCRSHWLQSIEREAAN
ncbi:MAG: thymidine kinase [Ponticaulis sp.]|nr:thymidine kinase [Ponticaulis sp.]